MIVETKRREDGYLNAVQVIEIIQQLSHSQGFYGRLLRQIKNFSAEEMRTFIKAVEEQNFKDSVDVVMFFEC